MYFLPSLRSVSIIYLTSSSTNSCISSLSNVANPKFCQDPDCDPLGSACKNCYFARSMKLARIDSDTKELNLILWLEEMGFRCEFADEKGSVFGGGAEEMDVDVECGGERGEKLVEEKNKVKTASQPSSLSFRSSPATSSTPSLILTATINKSKPQLPAQLSPWLNKLFDNTLSGHKNDTVFAGGADQENGVNDPCPYCFQPLGDWRLQHEQRCKFAHEELAREEMMMGYY